MVREISKVLVSDLIQSGIITDVNGVDGKLEFLRSLDPVYFQNEVCQCYVLPCIKFKGAVIESIPRVILDSAKELSIEKSLPLVPIFAPVRFAPTISAMIGPIPSHLGSVQTTPIGAQISPLLVPFVNLAISHRYGLVGSETDSIVALNAINGRIEPVAGYIRPVISPTSSKYLHAIKVIARVSPPLLRVTTMLFPGTTSTVQTLMPIIEKTPTIIGGATIIYNIIKYVGRFKR